MRRTAMFIAKPLWRVLAFAVMYVAVSLSGTFTAPPSAATLGDLSQRVEEAVSRHNNALAEFRVVLAAKRIATDATHLCSDPDLLRLIVQCVTEHQNAASALREMQSRTATETNLPMEQQRALDRANRLYSQLPPLHTSAFELAGAGGCDPYRVAVNVDDQAASDQAERNRKRNEENAEFLDELLSEYANDGPAEGEAETETLTGEPADESAPPTDEWDHAAFSRLYLQYKATSDDFRQNMTNFLDRLDLLSAGGEEVCHDDVVAYSYAEAQRLATLLAQRYEAIVGLVLPLAPLGMAHSALIAPGSADLYSYLPIEDQVAFAGVVSDFEHLGAVFSYTESELRSRAEGCDLDELADQGRRTAEEGQDTESGIDAGAGVVTGGGPIDEGPLRYELEGAPIRPPDDKHVTCTGGSLTLEVGTVQFPDVVQPDGSYNVRVPVSWSVTGSQVDDFAFGVAVTSFGKLQQSDQIHQFSGSRTFTFTFGGSDVEFILAANTIVVTVVGGIQCATDSSPAASASIAQPYYLRGSE